MELSKLEGLELSISQFVVVYRLELQLYTLVPASLVPLERQKLELRLASILVVGTLVFEGLLVVDKFLVDI
jgi:hypothetical protein